MAKKKPESQKKTRKTGLIVGGLLAVVLVGGYCLLCAFGGGGNVYPNVVMGDVALGGLTVEEAEAAISQAVKGQTPDETQGVHFAITDTEGKEYNGIGLAAFTSAQGKRRIVEDVYGQTDLYPEPIVGFMNKCSVLSGVEAPLITSMAMGFGNEAKGGPEGFHWNNVFASQLTGPILAKNPRLLDTVIAAIYQHRGETLPAELPRDDYAEAGFAVTAEQLKLRCQ